MEYIITELSTLSLQNSYRDDIYVFINEKDCNNVQHIQHIASSNFGSINI